MRSQSLASVIEMAAPAGGVFSAAQAGDVGISRKQLRDAERTGVLRRLHPSVFWVGSGAVPRRGRIRAAVLAVGHGAVPSHESSLFLHGVRHVEFAVAVSAAPAAQHILDGVRVHRVRDLLPEHVVVVDGIATTTVERALVDLAGVVSRVRLEWLLDHLTVTTRRTSIGRIARVVRQINRRGRRRIGDLTGLLDARAPTEGRHRSLLERTADELLASSGLPSPEAEYPLPELIVGTGSRREFVDRAWPDIKLILEIDGRSWHAREQDMARDRRRDRQAAAVGWQTLRVLDEEVRDIADEVVADLLAAYAERATLLRPAS